MAANLTTAVVLVGGSGLRMRPLTEDMPKCMIPLHGRPLIHWTLTWLKEQGINHVVLGVSYCKDAVISYVRDHPFGMRVDFSEHTQEGETGEGFRLAIERYVADDNFFAMNGDELTNLNLRQFAEFHLDQKGVVTIAASPMQSPFAILDIEGNDIKGFKEKPLVEDIFVSAGIYVFNQAITSYLPQTGSIERLSFPALAAKHLLKAYRLKENERWLTVNCVKDLAIAEKDFMSLRSCE